MDKTVHDRAASDSASIPLFVLILEDDPRDVELCIQELIKAGFEPDADTVDSEEAFAARLQSRAYDLILSDFRIPTWSGIEAFHLLQQSGKDIPFILVTGTLGEEAAVGLIKEGVADYILKDRLVRLPSAVRRALQEKKTRDERERAIQFLRESEEQVRLLLDSTAEAIYGINFQGNCTFCNLACVRLLGYNKPDDLLEKQMHSLIHHTRADGTPYPVEECLVHTAVREGKGTHVDHEVLWRKDGSSFPAEYWSYPMLRNGQPIGSVVTFLDITERRTNEENLQRVAAVVESSHDAIISETLDGIVLTWNPGAERIYGYSSAEVLGKSLSIIVPHDRRPEFRDLLEKIKRGQKVEQLETICVKKDGQQVRVSLTVSPIMDGHGGVASASAIARDITETKRMEEMFRQAQKMEAVGRLAGGVAHDFNNLLSVIIGYGEIVEESLKKDDPLRAKAEQINKAGRRAVGLTRQLLAFSRQQILEPTILNLNSIVSDVHKMLQRLIGEDIELVTALAPHLASVKADQGQIEQIIMNLAVNSRDAMPEGGTLTIETANLEADELYALNHPGLVAGSYVMLRVTDVGTGMDAETQKHIFEPFFTTKEQGKGTGLGLATVYGVIKQSSGYISVNSALGQGTTFEIYLPQVRAAPKPELQSIAPNDLPKGMETVLLVEDEESLRTLTRDVLLESHYTILEASDGLEALEIAQQHKGPIHLLLTDVVMPRMGGPALAKRLAVQNPEMKVLFMSGYAGNAHQYESVGAASFLRKPFSRRDLSEKVREALESRSLLTSSKRGSDVSSDTD